MYCPAHVRLAQIHTTHDPVPPQVDEKVQDKKKKTCEYQLSLFAGTCREQATTTCKTSKGCKRASCEQHAHKCTIKQCYDAVKRAKENQQTDDWTDTRNKGEQEKVGKGTGQGKEERTQEDQKTEDRVGDGDRGTQGTESKGAGQGEKEPACGHQSPEKSPDRRNTKGERQKEDMGCNGEQGGLDHNEGGTRRDEDGTQDEHMHSDTHDLQDARHEGRRSWDHGEESRHGPPHDHQSTCGPQSPQRAEDGSENVNANSEDAKEALGHDQPPGSQRSAPAGMNRGESTDIQRQELFQPPEEQLKNITEEQMTDAVIRSTLADMAAQAGKACYELQTAVLYLSPDTMKEVQTQMKEERKATDLTEVYRKKNHDITGINDFVEMVANEIHI